jgi:CheY-like chemotaxis protein
MGKFSTVDVILIEDDPADIYLIQRAVADCIPQAMVWPVSNGSQALAFLRHEPPFPKVPSPVLILLDLGIPGRDGYAVLTELRTLQSVLILTFIHPATAASDGCWPDRPSPH